MPMQKERYPKDWKNISLRIRERDGQKCKFCGVPNHALILRRPATAEYILYDSNLDVHIDQAGEWIRTSALPDWTGDIEKYTEVVLTVAHLGAPHSDGTPGNKHDKMDCREENLAALCQRCHLLEDMGEHIANRKKTLRQKRIEAQRQYDLAIGQKSLFEVLP